MNIFKILKKRKITSLFLIVFIFYLKTKLSKETYYEFENLNDKKRSKNNLNSSNDINQFITNKQRSNSKSQYLNISSTCTFRKYNINLPGAILKKVKVLNIEQKEIEMNIYKAHDIVSLYIFLSDTWVSHF